MEVRISMIILHRICQIPMNCAYKQLLASATVLETFTNSSPFPVKFWFYTVKIVSTEWRDLAQRQRVCDCSGIHHPH